MMVTVDDVTVDDGVDDFTVDDVTVDVVPGRMFLWVLLNLVRLPVSLLKGPPPNHIAIRIVLVCVFCLCAGCVFASSGQGQGAAATQKRT